MIRPSIRVASAFVAIVLCVAVPWPASFVAVLFALPLFVSWQPPTLADLESIQADLARYRTAMFTCFVASYVIFIIAVTTRGLHADALQRLAALGGALWIVAFLLLFPTAYYASRRALVPRDEE